MARKTYWNRRERLTRTDYTGRAIDWSDETLFIDGSGVFLHINSDRYWGHNLIVTCPRQGL